MAVTDKAVIIAAMDAILELTGASWVRMGVNGITYECKCGTEFHFPWPDHDEVSSDEH